MGEGIKLGSGSGKIINALINEYLSQEEVIDANTFVEFVNQSTTAGKQLTSAGVSVYQALLLDPTRVIMYGNVADDTYVVVCKIIGTTMTKGEAVDLGVGSNSSSDKVQMVKIDDDKIFGITVNSNGNGYAYILTINDVTVTKKTTYTISGSTYAHVGALLALNATTVLEQQDAGKLYLWTISGTTISRKSAVTYGTGSQVGKIMGMCKVSDSKALIVYSMPSDQSDNTYYNFITFRLVTVSSTTMTLGTPLVTEFQTGGFVGALPDGKMVCIVPSSQTINGFCVRVENDEIICGPLCRLSFGNSTANWYVGTTDSNMFVLARNTQNSSGTTYKLVLVAVVEMLLIPSEPLSAPTGVHGGFVTNERILTTGSYMGVYDYVKDIRIKKSDSSIQGVTKSRATTTSYGKVSTLDI